MTEQYNEPERTQENYDEEMRQHGHPLKREDLDVPRRYGGQNPDSDPAGTDAAPGFQKEQDTPYEQRPDRQIYNDVWDRLSYDERLDADQIEVKVEQGKVLLLGQVASAGARQLAEEIVKTVPHLKGVYNQLRVEGEPERPDRGRQGWAYDERDSDDYQQKTYGQNPYPGSDPRLDTYPDPEDSYSEYETVPSGPAERQEPAEDQGANVRIADEIYQGFKQHGWLKVANIEVQVNNTQVILLGTVNSPEARHTAEEIASSVEGVSQTINKLQVKGMV